MELVDETGSLEMMAKGWKRRWSRIKGLVGLEG
jgi:hypothetical protein